GGLHLHAALHVHGHDREGDHRVEVIIVGIHVTCSAQEHTMTIPHKFRLAAVVCCALLVIGSMAQAQDKKPNILVIFGDDIGVSNVSAYSLGLMGYRTPNIDRIAKEGMMFTDYYAEQSCTAGRSAFITGIATLRTGLSKVGAPGATVGLQAKDPTIAERL